MTEAMQTIPANDERLTWEGAVSVERTDEWAMPWRLPHPDKALFPPAALVERASWPAGVRLRFATDSGHLRLHVTPRPGNGKLDMVCDDNLIETISFAQGDTRIETGALPPGKKLIELWLPNVQTFQLTGMEVDGGALLERSPDNRPRWITYGSSISQCAAAQSPAYTWPAIVARECGLNLTCLGYGGNCHAEANLARMIRDMPADYISLKIGINVMGSISMGPRAFLPAIIGFVCIVREKHPDIPLVMCSPILSAPRETADNAAGINLTKMRCAIEEAVAIFLERGDKNIHYVDGLRLIGPDEAHLQPDNCHPNAEGYQVLGAHFIREAAAKYFV